MHVTEILVERIHIFLLNKGLGYEHIYEVAHVYCVIYNVTHSLTM